MKNQIVFRITVTAVLASTNLLAQNSFNASSHSGTIQHMNFSYAIGEMALIQTGKIENLTVTQGYLQPTNTPSNTNNFSLSHSNMNLANLFRVYPNPTKNILNIETKDILTTTFSCQLFDAFGKRLLSESNLKIVNPSRRQLDLNELPPGNYCLMISLPDIKGAIQLLSYKIIKQD